MEQMVKSCEGVKSEKLLVVAPARSIGVYLVFGIAHGEIQISIHKITYVNNNPGGPSRYEEGSLQL